MKRHRWYYGSNNAIASSIGVPCWNCPARMRVVKRRRKAVDHFRKDLPVAETQFSIDGGKSWTVDKPRCAFPSCGEEAPHA